MTPEEILEYSQTVHLQAQDYAHSVVAFIESLALENVTVFDRILSNIESTPEYGNYLKGLIAIIAREKHGICVCGHDHDAEAKLLRDQDIKIPNLEKMSEYNLEYVKAYRDGQPHPTGLRCKSCFKAYVSLTDRMLRASGVDGCDGCKIKSAHGTFADKQ